MKNEKDFLGLDIGTDSVGYAVTDTTEYYNLLKHGGEPMWGVTLFENANTAEERRTHRVDRRRLDRRQQRVKLVQELFAKEIANVDSSFFKRISESALLREDSTEPYCLFNDSGFTDKEYHKRYPTIHHLIMDLIEDKKPHDVRLVYIACAWLVAHRGHFLSEVSKEKVDELLDFKKAYKEMMKYFEDASGEDYSAPWNLDSKQIKELERILKKSNGINYKYSEICGLLFDGKKPKAVKTQDESDGFPFNVEGILKLLCGGEYKLSKLFINESYDELGSVSLSMDDEKTENIKRETGDDFELISILKNVYDVILLSDILNGNRYISKSKIEVYNQHKKDLKDLKSYIRKHCSKDVYDSVLRKYEKDNYVSYCGSTKNLSADEISAFKSHSTREAFCEYLKNKLNCKTKTADELGMPKEMFERIQAGTFMPKQVDGENRVIPYQLYYIELKKILENASDYLPFINESDSDGYVTKEKLLSIMDFRVPYFVGPLNKNNNEHAWIERKAEGKIYPWNFDNIVDGDESEKAFIDRMTNTCSYLAGEECLPKHSLLYEKFEVLNEINNLKINGQDIPVETKQAIYTDLFEKREKVSLKIIYEYLSTKNLLPCGVEHKTKNVTKEFLNGLFSGIDTETGIKSSLSSRIAFSRLNDPNQLTQDEVEEIIRHRTYSEDGSRFRRWIYKEYSKLSEEDRKKVSSLKFKEFGRLSRQLLDRLVGKDMTTGNENTVIGFMWETNDNASEILLSDRYSFREQIELLNKEYYSGKKLDLNDRLDEMYVSNAVKRPIIRTLEIVKDVVKATGHAPEKIFVEMARGATEEQKNKRTKSRRNQLIELYSKVKDEDVRELAKVLERKKDNELQSDKLFLSFTQLGRCMYSGKKIDIEKLGQKCYDIDHIYPQSFVKDDSIINNKVLVLSEKNGEKGNKYPVSSDVQNKMKSFWDSLRQEKLISDEKYRRLTRQNGFSEDEAWGFINRQLVETRQSAKIITDILKEKYPDSQIVYVKAGLVSDFRHDFDMLKSRAINDLHHAKDAYLNIVCGNVYSEKFTNAWFKKTWNGSEYTANPETLFNHKVKKGTALLWNPDVSFSAVRKTIYSNSVHETVYAFCRHGGLFDQQPVKKDVGLVERKSGLPTEKYGGYNKPSISYFILAKYYIGNKSDIMIVPVQLLYAEQIEKGIVSYEEYAKDRIENIINKKNAIDKVEFPLGYRKIKINTVLSLDGFKGVISGSASGGRCLIFSPLMPLKLEHKWETYIKRIESFVEKCSENSNLKYDEAYDRISKKDNEELYSILSEKHNGPLYSKRPNPQGKTVHDGFDKFCLLDVKQQALSLLNIIQSFGRIASGCDFELIGGKKHSAATVNFSSSVSNWSKKYGNVRIIDYSTSGLWMKESVNLLELL